MNFPPNVAVPNFNQPGNLQDDPPQLVWQSGVESKVKLYDVALVCAFHFKVRGEIRGVRGSC